jgi:hypothetical protein
MCRLFPVDRGWHFPSLKSRPIGKLAVSHAALVYVVDNYGLRCDNPMLPEI